MPAPPSLDVPPTAQATADFCARLVDEPAIASLEPARRQDWKHIAGLMPLHARMEHRCPECRLWAADSSRVKVHFKAKRKAMLSRLENTEATAKRVAVGNPCRFCGRAYRTALCRHAIGCHVLWQSIYASLEPCSSDQPPKPTGFGRR